ncbi:UNVERIFIED_CONTAM: LEAF RUST 10 DISEASE-RESISTANCE LOCUS RECEPTOR-LIKE PROTEIN KINASE-like 1.2 [Sesamum latifolium]|uniref:LEAF RUST 10 DISEASE-RESISTANCE LOCUS RECEPTOR-LIKE PROTEIN KINASE-like 1.2 n=1 Tax=Sesamum latifolium TaxID=2727402 RepID=A0AAW2VCB4_9LAMI
MSDLDWSNTLNIIKKLESAIEYIHCLAGGYLHRDIKCDNVLLIENYGLKLSDFGTMIQEDGERRQSDDVYSFAVIILQIILKSRMVAKDNKKYISRWAFEAHPPMILSHYILQKRRSARPWQRYGQTEQVQVKPPSSMMAYQTTPFVSSPFVWQDITDKEVHEMDEIFK